MNQRNRTVVELWDRCNLKCTFRKCVDSRLFNLWEEVLNTSVLGCTSARQLTVYEVVKTK
jgi:hypothetical protein